VAATGQWKRDPPLFHSLPRSTFTLSYSSRSAAGAETSAEVEYERDSLIGLRFLNIADNQYQIRPDRPEKRDCVWAGLPPEPDELPELDK
jgi:hypothetical protein